MRRGEERRGEGGEGRRGEGKGGEKDVFHIFISFLILPSLSLAPCILSRKRETERA